MKNFKLSLEFLRLQSWFTSFLVNKSPIGTRDILMFKLVNVERENNIEEKKSSKSMYLCVAYVPCLCRYN
jgi:hypothetical protein